MTSFEGNKNKSNIWGYKDALSSIKGSSGFVLDTKQIAIVEKYNEAVRHGTYQHSQLTKIVGNNNKELKQYLRSLNGAIAETKQFHNATLLGATGLKGMGTALKTVGATVKATMIQFVVFAAISLALGKAWDWVQKIWVENVNTLSNLKKRAETATEAKSGADYKKSAEIIKKRLKSLDVDNYINTIKSNKQSTRHNSIHIHPCIVSFHMFLIC